MNAKSPFTSLFLHLNSQQLQAATADLQPVLIVAGAGTGKTTTLVHRVAWLIAQGIDPSRVLLLTFTRRAAAEMLRRVDGILGQLAANGWSPQSYSEDPLRARTKSAASLAANSAAADDPWAPLPCAAASVESTAEACSASSADLPSGAEREGSAPDGDGPRCDAAGPQPRDARRAPGRFSTKIWGGTFHAVANRLLRRFGRAIGLSADFSVLDQSDAEDLMNVARTDLGLAKTGSRFPNKATCLAIYSRCVNARQKLDEVLVRDFEWCKSWRDELRRLFDAYVDRKEQSATLDYDDLLLYWLALLEDEHAGAAVRELFDCVLVDEYQDTNVLQAEIIYRLSPTGRGLTAVGDDAQSIYSFRAATVRNILDFPRHYPAATVLPLEQNYRSTQPILAATNAVLALAAERYEKNLWSQREVGEKPAVVSCLDEADQADYVIARILEHREIGIPLRRQAVLFRASHHSMLLEAELARRGIPFHKYGGLKFVETAHIKDLLAFLRLAENPRDVVASGRVLLLLPGIGTVKARDLTTMLVGGDEGFSRWRAWKPPAATGSLWGEFLKLLEWLAATAVALPAQIERVRRFYKPLAEGRHDNLPARMRDLEQLEVVAARYGSRRRMLVELTLDPPNSTQDFAGPPLVDDDYLVLSTIHSAKGLEWDAVYVLHATDGNIPSDMATKSPEQIEEERRLFYVAMTRARTWLYVCQPLRYYHSPGFGAGNTMAQRTRFLPTSVLPCFEQRVSRVEAEGADDAAWLQTRLTSESIRRRAKRLWD